MLDSIPQDTPHKQCKGCLKWFPATLEYFHSSKSNRYGINDQCKSCRAIQSRAYREANHAKDLERKRIYREAHYESEKEKRRQYKQAYDRVHQEHIRQRSKAYRDLNKEKVEASRKNFLINNPNYDRERKHRRRAREKDINGSHTAQDIQKQYERQKGKCYWCHKKVGTDKGAFHVDHVIPLAKGGSNNPENIVIACPTCNMRKCIKLWSLF